jgi:hypothetical protein
LHDFSDYLPSTTAAGPAIDTCLSIATTTATTDQEHFNIATIRQQCSGRREGAIGKKFLYTEFSTTR